MAKNGITSIDFDNERQEERERMVKEQIARRGIADAGVLEAMARLPRHRFVAEETAALAYSDSPLSIGFEQTISQPYIVALMSEALALTGRERVLEIGTGSGYQTAILAHLAKRVFSLERIAALAQSAQSRLEMLKIDNVEIIIGDGTQGYPAAAPFERIIVSAAASRIPSALLEQLQQGGILVLPVDYKQDAEKHWQNSGQRLLKITLLDAETMATNVEEICACRFVRLIGAY